MRVRTAAQRNQTSSKRFVRTRGCRRMVPSHMHPAPSLSPRILPAAAATKRRRSQSWSCSGLVPSGEPQQRPAERKRVRRGVVCDGIEFIVAQTDSQLSSAALSSALAFTSENRCQRVQSEEVAHCQSISELLPSTHWPSHRDALTCERRGALELPRRSSASTPRPASAAPARRSHRR